MSENHYYAGGYVIHHTQLTEGLFVACVCLYGGEVCSQEEALEALFTVAIVKRSLMETIEIQWYSGSLENLPTS